MSTKVIRPEQFEKVVIDLMKKYGDDVADVVKTASKSIARQGVNALKASAPAGGRYARGWSHKKTPGSGKAGTIVGEVIYNRTDYQLTHLLEKPHATGRYRGGRYPKKANYTGTIASVEEEYTRKYVEEVMAKL